MSPGRGVESIERIQDTLFHRRLGFLGLLEVLSASIL